jgi:hypothetical protein
VIQVQNAIAGIETGKYSFWTSDGGKTVRVIIATHEGHKYLKTESDAFIRTIF